MLLELDSWTVRLVRLARQLGALSVGGSLSDAEKLVTRVSEGVSEVDEDQIATLRSSIVGGRDPLGSEYLEIKERASRHRAGMFYTDPRIVSSMVSWTLSREPARIVDPGCGSGRFTVAAGRQEPDVSILAYDTDPVATLLCRANVAAVGLPNVRVVNEDFTEAEIPRTAGRTAFVGNPPYVRHHALTPRQKAWATATSTMLGHKLSQLAGLHAHFFFATAMHAKPGDVGCYITSAEWLDTNYGAGLRALLLDGLGLEFMRMFDHNTAAFPDAMTTALITHFEVGREPGPIALQRVKEVADLEELRPTRRLTADELKSASKWGQYLRTENGSAPEQYVRLGQMARVHRGAVTGCNKFFVMSGQEAGERGLTSFVRPVLTSAADIFAARGVIRAATVEKVVLTPARNVDLESREAAALAQYLEEGVRQGVPDAYVCSHRRPWWSIGFKAPPPIIATYMARQPPAFALNPDGVLILNVLHGIYPRASLSTIGLKRLVSRLNSHREEYRHVGRLYHGGLQKLEPSEMESLQVLTR